MTLLLPESAGSSKRHNSRALEPTRRESIRTLSAKTYRKMVQNLWWAAGYNILAIPLAWAGITLPMAIGATLMSLSAIIVAPNAQLLRHTKLTPDVSNQHSDSKRAHSL